jgi:hypothetical protein
MLTRDKDFAIDNEHGIIRCKPKTAEAASAFKVLQLAVQKLLPQVPDAPPVEIEVNGVIGPSLVLAVQVIAARLAEGKHPELAHVAIAQPEEAIPTIAESAMEITGYMERALTENPSAIIAPAPKVEVPPHPLDGLREIFTVKRVLAGTATLLGLGALVVLGSMARRRGLGLVDRSSLLPPSDGTDEFEEDEGDDDGDDEGTYHASGRVIDTTGVEAAA